MLLFIERPSSTLSTLSAGFNTSHVTLYLLLLVSLAPYQIRFNTSHVTLYQASQNALTAADSGFNTSHVTLYLNGKM